MTALQRLRELAELVRDCHECNTGGLMPLFVVGRTRPTKAQRHARHLEMDGCLHCLAVDALRVRR